MREIGGYFELEQNHGKEYYPDMYKLNLGRTALLFVLKTMHVHTLWVPDYICDSVTAACAKAGYRLRTYTMDENFMPKIEEPVTYGSCLYLINYYGHITNEQVQQLKKQHHFVILDNTHAFYQEPLKEIPTLYSLRKFFGLSDGAYASLGGLSPAIDLSMLEQDSSCGRMEHILGRYEADASTYYHTMLDNAHSLSQETVKRMSPLTENFLRGIDYEEIRNSRENNYTVLHEKLGKYNRLQWEMPKGPFSYPFYYKDGMQLRKAMAAEKIYVPTYWKNVLDSQEPSSFAYDCSANILPLPCDQRYDGTDMERVAAVCLACIEELERENA